MCTDDTWAVQGRSRPPWGGGLGNCMEELRRELVLGDGDEGRFAERREDTLGRRITT